MFTLRSVGHKAAAIAVALCVVTPTPGYAEQVFVRNRAYQGQSIKEGNTLLLEFQPLMSMLDLKVVRGSTGAWVLAGKEAAASPAAAPLSSFLVNGQEIALVEKEGRTFISLDQLSAALSLKVSRNAQLDSIDVYAAAAGSGSAGPAMATAPASAEGSSSTLPSPVSKGNSYTIAAIGLTFTAPSGCNLINDPAVLGKEVARSTQVMAELNQAGREMAAKTVVGLQFECALKKDARTKISFYTHLLPSGSVTVEQFLNSNLESTRKVFPDLKLVATTTAPRNIGGRDFRLLEFHVVIRGHEIRSRTYLCVDALRSLGYLITMSTEDQHDFQAMERMLAGFQFTR